jgi:hypothetical protein
MNGLEIKKLLYDEWERNATVNNNNNTVYSSVYAVNLIPKIKHYVHGLLIEKKIILMKAG